MDLAAMLDMTREYGFIEQNTLVPNDDRVVEYDENEAYPHVSELV